MNLSRNTHLDKPNDYIERGLSTACWVVFESGVECCEYWCIGRVTKFQSRTLVHH